MVTWPSILTLQRYNGKQTGEQLTFQFLQRMPVKNDDLGAVYTPELLGLWVASELSQFLPKNKCACIVDPACGDGALLKYVGREASQRHRFIGIDIDPLAIKKAKRNLGNRAQLRTADALVPSRTMSVEDSWAQLLGGVAPTGIISNPPWGAMPVQATNSLRSKGYSLAKGQYDSFDLFVELSLRIVSEGALLAFIVPDAVFFPEHRQLRSLLLARTRLHLIARLGEGFFEHVYRGTTVIICEKGSPPQNHDVACFRLKPMQRKKIFEGQLTLAAAKKASAHLVPQRRFQTDPENRFDIDVREAESDVFRKIRDSHSDWVEFLESGRGVELSKKGFIVLCPECATARPRPREGSVTTCPDCGVSFSLRDARSKSIVRTCTHAPRGWRRLIVGEDVRRYDCRPSRIIDARVRGINYKDVSAFEGPKLLVRKTGVGINAAIDESDSLTNQVVFHYRPLPKKAPGFFLDYVLGVMCSRVMLAYHLKRMGESEWRSHPYITQKTIAELPVPVPREGTWQWRQAVAIADFVRTRRRDTPAESAASDVRIDSFVAGLYGLTSAECDWVLRVLDEAQPLQSICGMRLSTGKLTPTRI